MITLKQLSILFLVLTMLPASGQPQFKHLNISDGLSHNQIVDIYKDRKGFMWFGTMSGLNRFDGYEFKIYRHNHDSSSIIDNYIYQILEDHRGNLMINTKKGWNIFEYHTETFMRNASSYNLSLGLSDAALTNSVNDDQGNYWYLTERSELFRYSSANEDMDQVDTTLFSAHLEDIALSPEGNLWIIDQEGNIYLIKPGNLQVEKTFDFSEHLPSGARNSFQLYCDSDGDLWFYNIQGDLRGLFFFNPAGEQFQYFHPDQSIKKLNNELVADVLEERPGKIWVGTDHGGINVIDKRDNFKINPIIHQEYNAKSLSQNVVTRLYKDYDGIIWVGTFKKGINYYHPDLLKFRHFEHITDDPQSLIYNDVNCFAEDSVGNLWIGTNGEGLLYYNRKKQQYQVFKHDPEQPGSISSNIIVCLFIDSNQNLWIGTYTGGLNCYNGQKFIRYQHDPSRSTSLASNNVWEIFEDSQGKLWVGTLGGGLDLFDPGKEVFYHYQRGAINSLNSNYISDILEDQAGNLWIGTAEGVDLMHQESGRVIHFGHQMGDPRSLSNDNVNDLHLDSRGKLWLGTRDGLNLYQPETHDFKIFRMRDGLPEDVIVSIREDQQGNLWMSTSNGLSKMTISSEKDSLQFDFENFDVSDGLQSREFNENAALALRTGEMIFGGSNGFNLFDPEKLVFNEQKPEVVLTKFQVFNENVEAGKKIRNRVLLDQSITETSKIVLPHSMNMFSLEFAALNYFQPEKNRYQYILEGFNENWLETDGSNRKAVYTNLDPGHYNFRVIAANNDGVWNQEGSNLAIEILPPFWKTPLAYLLYAIFIGIVLWLARRIVLERERLKYSIEHDRREAERIHALDVMKIRFFTNISHEFRTPLSLIMAPVEKLIKQSRDETQRKNFELIYRNAKRLLTLVNQLLDFRKLEVQELKLNASRQDAIGFIKEVAASFSDISEKRNISFSIHSHLEELYIHFDADKLERILFNLLSNAFKFTSAEGKVEIDLDLARNEKQEQYLQIKVSDTGIGIEPEKQDKIFNRFFQDDLPGTMVNQGSGIGLSITYEFVRLHQGEIKVNSIPGQGSCFTILLPLQEPVKLEPVVSKEPELMLLNHQPGDFPQLELDDKKPLILLVEDNEDLRFYLKDNLKSFGQILEAENGEIAWNLLHNFKPDLVVTDIVMPVVDGLELTKRIKSAPELNRIPVILLSARSSEEQKLEGFQAGADDYLVKPFNFEILLYKMKVLLQSRKHKSNFIAIEPNKLVIASADEKLVKKSISIIEKNISNPDFSVEELSREMGMSRVNLYKKLLALTGKSPIEFIRTIRIKQAAQLLAESQLSIAEVAYQVGFNNPKYFSKYFRQQFKILPSEYVQKNRTRSLK